MPSFEVCGWAWPSEILSRISTVVEVDRRLTGWLGRVSAGAGPDSRQCHCLSFGGKPLPLWHGFRSRWCAFLNHSYTTIEATWVVRNEFGFVAERKCSAVQVRNQIALPHTPTRHFFPWHKFLTKLCTGCSEVIWRAKFDYIWRHSWLCKILMPASSTRLAVCIIHRASSPLLKVLSVSPT